MGPDFKQKTVATLAKRARYICSNPDCRSSTVGPNSDPEKSTVLGEAAHIFGARSGSKRYSPEMTDTARSEITNAIWLCRNCHKRIDSDESYSAEILFAWREQHEGHVLSELGSTTDHLQFKIQYEKLSILEDCPPLIKRIAIDKPDGWEWRLTAELLRYLNQPLLQKIKDLREGLYYKPSEHIDEEYMLEWLNMRLKEAANLAHPIESIMERLTASWGKAGEEGNLEEIHHSCCLIMGFMEQVVQHEERVCFAIVPEQYEKVVALLKDRLGSQAEKVSEIPEKLDHVLSLINDDHGGTESAPTVISHTLDFELPRGWNRQYSRELDRAMGKRQSMRNIIIVFLLALFVIYVL